MMNSLFKWENGRQDGGYQKMLLLFSYFPIPFDIYIIKYNVGNYILPHTDPVKDGKHFRLNILLKEAKSGGKFICINPIYQSKHIKFFRPDISEHSVTEITEGKRYLLSIGWILH